MALEPSANRQQKPMFDINRKLASLLGLDLKDVELLTNSFAKAVGGALSDGNAVVLPSFGTLTPTTVKESIWRNPATGKLMMMPPKVEITYTPSTKTLTGLQK